MLMTGMGRRHPDVYQSMAGIGACDAEGSGEDCYSASSIDTGDSGTNWAPLWNIINQVTGAATNVIRTQYGTPTANPGGTVRLPNGTVVTGGYTPVTPSTGGTVAGLSTQTLLIGGAAFMLIILMMRKR